MIRNKKIAQIIFCITLATTSANAFDAGGIASGIADKFLSSFADGILGKLLGSGNGSSRLNKILQANNLNFCSFKPIDLGIKFNKGSNGICDLAKSAKSELSGLCSFIPGMTSGGSNPLSSALDDICSISNKGLNESAQVALSTVYTAMGLEGDGKLPSGKTLDQAASEMKFTDFAENSLLKNFYMKNDNKSINWFRQASMAKNNISIKDFKEENFKAPENFSKYIKDVEEGAELYKKYATATSLGKVFNTLQTAAGEKQAEEAQKAVEKAKDGDTVQGTEQITNKQFLQMKAYQLSNLINERPTLLTEEEIKNLRDPHLRTEARLRVEQQKSLESFILGTMLAKEAKRKDLIDLVGESVQITANDYIASGLQKEDTNSLIDTVKQVRGNGLPPELGGTESDGGLLDGVTGALGNLGNVVSGALNGAVNGALSGIGSAVGGALGVGGGINIGGAVGGGGWNISSSVDSDGNMNMDVSVSNGNSSISSSSSSNGSSSASVDVSNSDSSVSASVSTGADCENCGSGGSLEIAN